MTAQAQEILIFEGKRVYMMSCPPLPTNDPRVIKTPTGIICSARWRGYTGTWEIINGKLFLVNLSGDFSLASEAPVFADWYSDVIIVPEGEVLQQNSIGVPYLYESELRIKIENGVVVATSVKNNRPIFFEAEHIKKFVESRGIESLVHFTRVENVPSILVHGLLGRKTLISRGLNAEFNDQHRYDNVDDAVCVSISFPNYKMFYTLKRDNPGTDWAVVRLDPKILWELPCAYCFTNAASTEITSLAIEERKKLSALVSMFEDRPQNNKRSFLKIPEDYTTDPQAEVLVLGAIDSKYILDVNIGSEENVNNINAIKSLFKPYSDKFHFLHNRKLFRARKDYKHWQEDSIRSNRAEIVF